MPAVIELDRLSVRLGTRDILRDVQATLKGRAVGLLGPNGAGKSTLINTLLGFHPPTAGTARLLGLDIRTETRRARSLVGYMPENDSFIADMSAVSFVRYMAEISGLPHEQAVERAHEVLWHVGLGEVRYRPIGTYSLGMKQLVKLAQAIVHGPRLLFLDEPTNGLDPPARLRMLKLVKDIRDAGNVHLVLSSHLLRDVEEVCDEVLILKDGQVAAQCDLEAERQANKRFIEIELAEPATSFAEGLAQLGCECSLAGPHRIKLVLPDHLEVRDLYRIAYELRVQVRRLSHRRDSLEDLFLEAMERPALPRVAPMAEVAHGRL